MLNWNLYSKIQKEVLHFGFSIPILIHSKTLPLRKLNVVINSACFTLVSLTLFTMGFFGVAYGSGCKKAHTSLKSVTHTLPWQNLLQLHLTKENRKYMNHVTNPISSANISSFPPEIRKFCYINKYKYRFHFDT